MTTIHDRILSYLTSEHLPPSPAFLSTVIPSINATAAPASLQQTARYRLLASDLRTSMSPSAAVLPSSVSDPAVRELRLPALPIPVQVLDVEDIGRSRWAQVESLEAEERGETKKGQEIIRVVPSEDQQQQQSGESTTASTGPHKLLLQDAKGQEVYGLELTAVPKVGLGMGIGSKLMLKGAVVARGVVLLEPGRCEVLGGKVESWDRKWREERKAVLKQRAGWREDAIAVGGGE